MADFGADSLPGSDGNPSAVGGSSPHPQTPPFPPHVAAAVSQSGIGPSSGNRSKCIHHRLAPPIADRDVPKYNSPDVQDDALRCLSAYGASHFDWRNAEEILGQMTMQEGSHYYLINAHTGASRLAHPQRPLQLCKMDNGCSPIPVRIRRSRPYSAPAVHKTFCNTLGS